MAALTALTAVGALAAAKKDTKPGNGNAQAIQAPTRPVQAKSPEISAQSTVPSTSTKETDSTRSAPMPQVSVARDVGIAGTAAAYEIKWQCVSGGGGPAASANYQANATVGQSAIGFATSSSYEHGIGYWYGAQPGGGCSCPYQSDFDEDGFLTALDLSAMIDILFAGQPDVQDTGCPSPRADFDCDDFSTALDLSGLIDHLFAGGAGPCDPCA